MSGAKHPLILSWAGYTLNLAQRTHIMGVLNVTPDSFSDGGLFFERNRAVEQGLSMAREGADVIDVGGESTRPFSTKISEQEEMDRVIPVIEGLRRELDIPISIDTMKAVVAKEALRAGASMINDVSALRHDPEMASVAAQADVPIILMHMKGTPADMQKEPSYAHLIEEITEFLREARDRAVAAGIGEHRIVLDPGIGFGKTFDHNLEIIRELHRFRVLGRPILLGSSRKAFIGHILNREAHERDTGTMASVAIGVINGAHIVRVHNVRMALDTVRMADAITRGRVSAT
ncbi:MAG: dihydropteroate synthase [Deltaproteobacteria bacterium]|nr:dihydropteroate synthase [Deltaproteobacteria bacterium]